MGLDASDSPTAFDSRYNINACHRAEL